MSILFIQGWVHCGWAGVNRKMGMFSTARRPGGAGPLRVSVGGLSFPCLVDVSEGGPGLEVPTLNPNDRVSIESLAL